MRLLLLVLVLVGCTHTEPIAADPATAAPPRAVAAPPVTEADVKRVEAALVQPSYGPGASAALALGAACDASNALCGTAKRVALQVQHWPNPSAEPCKATVIGGPPDALNGGYVTSACLADNHLYARTPCTMCRMMTGTVLDAQLDELTPAQREHLRQRLVLPAKAPLATTADWQSALRAVTAP